MLSHFPVVDDESNRFDDVYIKGDTKDGTHDKH